MKADTQIWRSPELGAELLRGRFADFSYDVHAHDTACFALLTGGAIRIRMRGTEFVARAGDLYAIDADEPHAGWPVDESGWTQRTLYVDVAHLRTLIDTPTNGTGGLAGPIIRDTQLSAALFDVHLASETRGPSLYRDERYLAFAARLVGRHTRQGAIVADSSREPRAVNVARGFIDEHLADQISLDEIAAAADLPPFRLFRAFARATGMTPHEYQRQARVRHAMALIRHARGGALSQIALASGFADQAHLTRTFRRMLGVTPGAYRTATRD